MKLRLLTALGLAVIVAACGDGEGNGPSPADHPAGLLVAGDFDTASAGNESSDLMFAVQEAGFPLDTTSAMDSTSIAALIAGKDIVFFPELEPTFDEGTEAILEAFVEDGGILVLVGGYQHLEWVNARFGWTLENPDEWGEGDPMPRLPGASGTPFDDGPATIDANNGGGSLGISTLPAGAHAIYGGVADTTVASVAIIPSGDGWVVYFGWDWYDGAPFGAQDGGWISLLRRTAGL
jgi:hypothetical protein